MSDNNNILLETTKKLPEPNKLTFEFVIQSLFNSFSNHTFYAYLIQSLLILYAYVRGVGRNGKFWRVIYIGTLASFVGAIITRICEIIMEVDPNNTSDIMYYILIAHETFYAIRNLVLPYINMIKVMPLLEDKEKKKLKIFIGIMTVIQFGQRYGIGILRLKKRDITMEDQDIIRLYGFSVITISITDIVCSMIIIKKLIENYNIAVRKNLKISVYKYFFQSALFILIFVDFFSLVFGILAIVDNPILKVIFVPLYGLNCNIILLLAFDALIFKNDIMFDMNSDLDHSRFSSETFTNEMLEYDSASHYPCHSHCHSHCSGSHCGESHCGGTHCSGSCYQCQCHGTYGSRSFSQYHDQYQTQCSSQYYTHTSCHSPSLYSMEKADHKYNMESKKL